MTEINNFIKINTIYIQNFLHYLFVSKLKTNILLIQQDMESQTTRRGDDSPPPTYEEAMQNPLFVALNLIPPPVFPELQNIPLICTEQQETARDYPDCQTKPMIMF